MPINAKFIDFDYQKLRGFVPGNMGVSIFEEEECQAYADVAAVVPESQWRELCDQLQLQKASLCELVTRLMHQGREGSCVGHMWTAMHQVLQAKQRGKENVVQLSAISAYQLIGRSPNSGATVSNALKKGRAVGIIPLDNPENRARFGEVVMPPTGFYSKRPRGWEPVAAQFRFHEYLTIRSVNELISAMLNGHPVGVGRSGHSILYLQPLYDDGRLLVKYQDSYGPGAGDKGFRYDSMSKIRSSANWAFAVRSVVVPE